MQSPFNIGYLRESKPNIFLIYCEAILLSIVPAETEGSAKTKFVDTRAIR